MAKYPNIKLTQKGLDMAINADKTKKLIYTHIEIGDGRLTNNEDILNLTAIKSRKIYADIADINNDTNNQVTLETTVSNKVVDEGFYAREIGIYAKLGEDGEDILYGYANAGDNCDYMPDKTQPIDELKLRITLIVGNVDNVTAVIDSSIIFITLADCRREIQKHNIDLLAHDNLARKDDIYTKLEVDTKLNSKANTLHGNHVPETESANNTRFLRNDNTWQTVTPDNIGTYHKTEVDSRVNSKVSKSGDTMAGALTAPKFIASDGFYGNATTSSFPNGFGNVYFENCTWGNQDGRTITAWITPNDGCIDFRENNRTLNVKVDGTFYQGEGTYPVLDTRGGTITGAVTASTFYTNDWFRCNENCGIYWQKWGGGWYMQDSEWMRVFNNKSIYTPGRIRCEGGFEGTATNANNFAGRNFEQARNEFKTNIAILSGIISDSETIPIPSGFSEYQCKWIVSMANDNPPNRTWNIYETGSHLNYKFLCYTEGRKVICRTFFGGEEGNVWCSAHANYIVIGVK